MGARFVGLILGISEQLEDSPKHPHGGTNRNDQDEVEFVRLVAHMLRTPLNAVLGIAERIAASPTQSESKAIALELLRAARDLGTVAAHLFDPQGAPGDVTPDEP